tara:strand:- start:367 stop:480 length:114 start_codon:yes stop_codon:yes gene_type:complete
LKKIAFGFENFQSGGRLTTVIAELCKGNSDAVDFLYH